MGTELDLTPAGRAALRFGACKAIVRAHRQAALPGYFTARFVWHFCDIEVRQWSLENWDPSRGPLEIQAGLRALRGHTIGHGLEQGASGDARIAAEVLRDWAVWRHIRQQILPQHNVGDIVNADLATLSRVFPGHAAEGHRLAPQTRVATPMVRAHGERFAPALSELVGGPYTVLRPLFVGRSHAFEGDQGPSGETVRKAAWTANEAADAIARLVNAHWGHVRGPVAGADVLSAFARLMNKDPEFREDVARVGEAALEERRRRR